MIRPRVSMSPNFGTHASYAAPQWAARFPSAVLLEQTPQSRDVRFTTPVNASRLISSGLVDGLCRIPSFARPLTSWQLHHQYRGCNTTNAATVQPYRLSYRHTLNHMLYRAGFVNHLFISADQ